MYLAINKPKDRGHVWIEDKFSYNAKISKKMTYGRFQFIYSKFTFFSSKDKKDGKIVANQKISVALDKIFNKAFIPGENPSLDESMCAFKGRILNRVYEPMKPDKFGIKLHTICDSSASYLLNIRICGEKASIRDTVTILSDRYKNNYRILHMDNFYNPIKLSTELLEKKNSSNGTFRRRGGIPDVFIDLNVTKYNFFFGALENVVSIYNFNDNKKVVFGSAVFGDECTLIDKKT